MESYTTQRRLTHEFANHLEALSLMLQQNDVAGARGYLTSISKTIQMNSAILNTHNPLLDALLSKKYEEAARKGVMMYFDLSDLKDIPLDRTHLVIVVSNLLNNAIEAAAQGGPARGACPDEKDGGRAGDLGAQPGQTECGDPGGAAAPLHQA